MLPYQPLKQSIPDSNHSLGEMFLLFKPMLSSFSELCLRDFFFTVNSSEETVTAEWNRDGKRVKLVEYNQ